jgi:hypothetical protein
MTPSQFRPDVEEEEEEGQEKEALIPPIDSASDTIDRKRVPTMKTLEAEKTAGWGTR